MVLRIIINSFLYYIEFRLKDQGSSEASNSINSPCRKVKFKFVDRSHRLTSTSQNCFNTKVNLLHHTIMQHFCSSFHPKQFRRLTRNQYSPRGNARILLEIIPLRWSANFHSAHGRRCPEGTTASGNLEWQIFFRLYVRVNKVARTGTTCYLES